MHHAQTRRTVLQFGLVGLAATYLVVMSAAAAEADTTKTMTLASVNAAGVRGNGTSEQPSVSAAGRYLAFVSAASNLVPNDTNGQADIFLRDRQLGTIERVNVTSTGAQSTGTVGANGKGGLDLSGNGRVVVFNTNAALVPTDTNGTFDAYVRDLSGPTPTTERVSVIGTKSGSSAADISTDYDGSRVAFVSSQLAATPNRVDVLLHDRATGETTIVSRRDPTVPSTTGTGSSQMPSLNDDGQSPNNDGRYVIYSSAAPDQVPNDTNGAMDVFVRDTQGPETTARVSVAQDGTQASQGSTWPTVSATGRYVTFLSASNNLIPSDTNAQADYFLKDVYTGAVTQASIGGGTSGVGLFTNEGPAPVSADGRYVAFASRGGLASPTTSPEQVYLRDVIDSTTEVVTLGANNFSSGPVSFSADGNHVAFSSSATNLIPGTTTGGRQVFVADYARETIPHDTTPPLVTPLVVPASPDGDSSWYVSDVTLVWSVADSESPFTTVGCVDRLVNADQDATTYSCTATSSGGTTGPVEVTIRRDATVPTIHTHTSPTTPDGSNGWYVTAPNVAFSCDDLTSGIAGCTDTTSVPQGTGTIITGTATDVAGNTATVDAGPFKVDLTDPSLTCQSAGPFTLHGSGSVTADVTDSLSGPATPQATAAADTTTVGPHSVSLTGQDNAGRAVSKDCPYEVHYAFTGFSAPVNPDATNVVKAGSAVPLKWHLADAAGSPVTDLANVQLQVTTTPCDPDSPQDPLTEEASGTSGLQNLGDGDYQFNWKTPKTYANTCRILAVDLGEGAPRTADFRFTK
jgi:hypothetical protein